MDSLHQMFLLASKAKQNAYAPYSHFKVGCCIKTRSGKLFAGTNVENAAYPSGHCAETSAIGAMISQEGHTHIQALVIVADGPQLCTPCGNCLQKISEFSDDQTTVYIYGTEGLRQEFQLKDLFPIRFSKENL